MYLLVIMPRAFVQTCQAPSMAEVIAALRQQSCHSAQGCELAEWVCCRAWVQTPTPTTICWRKRKWKDKTQWKGNENAWSSQGNAALLLFLFFKDRCTCRSFLWKGLNSPLLYFGRAIKVNDSARTVAHCLVSVSGWMIDRVWRAD